MKNKIISFLLVGVFSLHTVAMAEDVINIIAFDKDTIQTIAPVGVVPLKDAVFDFEHSEEYIWGDFFPFEPFSIENIPSTYDAVAEGIVTKPKNQGQYGTCWAFSTISALETNMVKKGLADVNEVDYSERHLAFFAHTPNTLTADGQTTSDSKYGLYGGDNPIIASYYLTAWQGATLEEDFPYSPDGEMSDLTENMRYNSNVHMQDFYILSAEDVKSAVLEYGSVVCAYYDNTKYHTVHNSYFQNIYGAKYINHAVTIVGWDDSYSLNNFNGLKSMPKNSGAWKVKNSWGENWGDDGYFWISYEDTSLSNFVAVNAESADNYQIIHHYDGANNTAYGTCEKSANIFTVDMAQTLEAVGFFTNHGQSAVAPVLYTAKIYCLKDGYSNPEDGTLLSEQSGIVEYDGYHTIELDTPVGLEKNDKFSVVLTLKNPSGTNAYHSFEGSQDSSSKEGESFIYTSSWASSGNLNNARIRAYSSLEPATVSFNTNGADSLQSIHAPMYSLLEIPETPQKPGYYFAGWFRDSALTTEWNFEADKVTENTTLYARWSATPVQAESISITGDTFVFEGKTTSLSAHIHPYYTTDKTITWSSSGEGASVADGVVTGITSGNYTITATLSNDVSAVHSLLVHSSFVFQLIPSSPVFNTTDQIAYGIHMPTAEYFCFYLKTPDGKILYIKDIENPGNRFGFTIGNYAYIEGKYQTYAVAYDSLGNAFKSQTIPFWVTDVPTLVCASHSNRLEIGAYNGSAGSQVILSYYNNGKLENAKIYSEDILDTMKTIPYDYSYTELKVFWWDSLTGLRPVTEKINLTEYNRGVIISQ